VCSGAALVVVGGAMVGAFVAEGAGLAAGAFVAAVGAASEPASSSERMVMAMRR